MTTIFSRIIKGELPCRKVFENERVIAFWDIAPQAPVHILIVSKKELKSLQEAKEKDQLLLGEMLLIATEIAHDLDIQEGYRLLTNIGSDAGQVIHHLHFHLLGGRVLGHIA
ncbi:MAG: histidine triad nucleotide-binding protein [Chlamydiota bacterium]